MAAERDRVPLPFPHPRLVRSPRSRRSSWGQAGAMTCRRRYVPQVGQAACGSFGLRHCGQLTSVGAAVFHWARRERVLLRDILRLGTATSALLSVFYSVRNIKLAKRAPAGIGILTVPVERARVGEPR